MNSTQVRLVATAVLLVCIFLTGFWLSKSGKPFNGLLLTGHKLISLAAGAVFVTLIQYLNQSERLSGSELSLVLLTGLFFIATIATGGVLSSAKSLPAVILRLHQVTPYLTLICGAVSLYLLLAARLELAKTG